MQNQTPLKQLDNLKHDLEQIFEFSENQSDPSVNDALRVSPVGQTDRASFRTHDWQAARLCTLHEPFYAEMKSVVRARTGRATKLR